MTEREPDPAATALRTAAALATCAVRGNRDDMEIILDDAIDPTNPEHTTAGAVVAATAHLLGKALTVVAKGVGRDPADFVAGIASAYRAAVGAHSCEALLCYAAAMSVGGKVELQASMVSHAVAVPDPSVVARTAANVLALAWRHQAEVEKRDPIDIGQAITLATR